MNPEARRLREAPRALASVPMGIQHLIRVSDFSPPSANSHETQSGAYRLWRALRAAWAPLESAATRNRAPTTSERPRSARAHLSHSSSLAGRACGRDLGCSPLAPASELADGSGAERKPESSVECRVSARLATRWGSRPTSDIGDTRQRQRQQCSRIIVLAPKSTRVHSKRQSRSLGSSRVASRALNWLG